VLSCTRGEGPFITDVQIYLSPCSEKSLPEVLGCLAALPRLRSLEIGEYGKAQHYSAHALMSWDWLALATSAFRKAKWAGLRRLQMQLTWSVWEKRLLTPPDGSHAVATLIPQPLSPQAFSDWLTSIPATVVELGLGYGLPEACMAVAMGHLQQGALPHLTLLAADGCMAGAALAAAQQLLLSRTLCRGLRHLSLTRLTDGASCDVGRLVELLPCLPHLIELRLGDLMGSEPCHFHTLLSHITAGRLPCYRDPPFGHLRTRWCPSDLVEATRAVASAFRQGCFARAAELEIKSVATSDDATAELLASLPPLPLQVRLHAPSLPAGQWRGATTCQLKAFTDCAAVNLMKISSSCFNCCLHHYHLGNPSSPRIL
jgi:hypothetical protein